MADRMSFPESYARKAGGRRSILCVGLDPAPSQIPPQFGGSTDDIDEVYLFLYKVLEIVADKVAVVKPNMAYFEAMGLEGLAMLRDLTGEAQEMGLIVILDAKRADIGRSMEAYGKGLFEHYSIDAATCHSYFGATFLPSQDGKSQGWMKYLREGACAITMVRTSNPEGTLLQDSELESGRSVHELLAQQTATWDARAHRETGGMGSVGAVIGATTPLQARNCRILAPDVFFLVPGYGAQGGGAKDAVAGMPPNGELLVTVNSSSGITGAWKNKDGDPLDHIALAIDKANSELNEALLATLGFDPYAGSIPFYDKRKPVKIIGGEPECTSQE